MLCSSFELVAFQFFSPTGAKVDDLIRVKSAILEFFFFSSNPFVLID